MKSATTTSIYLDKRRPKKDGTFPVKLAVYCPSPKKQKLYSTKFDLTEKAFERIWETQRPRKEHLKARNALRQIELHAHDAVESLDRFTFEAFEKRLFRNKGDGVNVEVLYNDMIQSLTEKNQIGTASNYRCSRNSLQSYVSNTQRTRFNQLTLIDITPDWLNDYERYMLESGKSLTTVGIYLRPLKAIFNKAIDDEEVDKKFYPFGKRRYMIPSTSIKKKALNNQQLNSLFNAKPINQQQQKAKDFWFFSYSSNGMNTKDIALLRWSDLDEKGFVFVRAKTARTSKANQKQIRVLFNDFNKSVIEEYGVADNRPKDYVFGIVDSSMSFIEQHKAIQNFNRLIAQHIKKLAVSVGITEKISPYWARHSFATRLMRNGAPIEFSQEALGHSSKQTTQGYFAGFDDDTKEYFLKDVMNF